jgi:hypothetical protein
MAEYRIVKWWPSVPQAKQPAVQQVFTDRELAERIKTSLEQDMPHRCFAVELIQLEERQQ